MNLNWNSNKKIFLKSLGKLFIKWHNEWRTKVQKEEIQNVESLTAANRNEKRAQCKFVASSNNNKINISFETSFCNIS